MPRARSRLAQPRAFVGTPQIGPHLDERIEDRVGLVGGYSDACVRDGDGHLVLVRIARDDDAPSGIRELHGVGEKIHEDLAQLLRVGPGKATPAGPPPEAVLVRSVNRVSRSPGSARGLEPPPGSEVVLNPKGSEKQSRRRYSVGHVDLTAGHSTYR